MRRTDRKTALAGLRGLAPLVFLVLGSGAAGCEPRDASPNLLEVSGLNPRSLEVGDRLSLEGSGFPEGRPAKISFHGDVLRAGRTPLRDVTVTALGAASEPHVISTPLTAELAREFCGEGDAVHATFRGAVTAYFAAKDSAAPPVRGTLEGVVLDVNPASVSKASLRAHEAEATRFGHFVGMTVVHSEERDVLLVDGVEPDGRAARAGLRPGDALLELDGLRLASLSDLIPPPRERLSHLSVLRGDETTPATFALDSAGFQPGSPAELVPAATLVGFAVLVLLLLASPLWRALTRFEVHFALRLRGRMKPWALAQLPRDRKPTSVARTLLREMPSSPLPYFVFIADSAWLTLLAINRTIWARELDLPVLLLGSTTALCAAALVVGGRVPGRRFSLLRGLRHVALTLLFQVPVLVALAQAVLLSGSLRSDDIVAAQGGWPWQWFAFASPISGVIFGLLLLGLLPLLSHAPRTLGNTPTGEGSNAPRARRVTLPEWSHLILTSGVIALVFLGGPRVPGLAASDAEQSVGLQVIAALLFQVKAVLVTSAVLALRFACDKPRLAELSSLGVRVLLPCAALCSLATFGFSRAGQNPLFAAARLPLSAGLVSLSVLCAGHVLARVAGHLARERPRSSVNPWL